MKLYLLLYIVIKLILPGTADAAETAYQWTDNQGQTHYGDRPPGSVESSTIVLQRNTTRKNRHSGLRPGEREQLSQMKQHQRQQQHSALTAKSRTDRQRAAARTGCADNREMLRKSRGRDTFKQYSRYLRNNCW